MITEVYPKTGYKVDLNTEIDRDRARAGNRTGCATGSEQDVTPEVCRKRPKTGIQTKCDTGSLLG